MLEFQILDTEGLHWRGTPRKAFTYVGRGEDHSFLVTGLLTVPPGKGPPKNMEVFLFGQYLGKYSVSLGLPHIPEGSTVHITWSLYIQDARDSPPTTFKRG